jgi:ATP-dependent metalloprotease
MSSQFWRTLRTLGAALILVSCLSTLLDEKGGLGKSLMSSAELKPQHQTHTKVADVMGVDEVRGSWGEAVYEWLTHMHGSEGMRFHFPPLSPLSLSPTPPTHTYTHIHTTHLQHAGQE